MSGHRIVIKLSDSELEAQFICDNPPSSQCWLVRRGFDDMVEGSSYPQYDDAGYCLAIDELNGIARYEPWTYYVGADRDALHSGDITVHPVAYNSWTWKYATSTPQDQRTPR